MVNPDLRRVALRYGVGWGSLTAAALVAAGIYATVPPKLLGAVMVAVGLTVGPLAVGLADFRVETVAASARLGFSVENADRDLNSLPVPHSVKAACWSTVVGLYGVALLALTA